MRNYARHLVTDEVTFFDDAQRFILKEHDSQYAFFRIPSTSEREAFLGSVIGECNDLYVERCGDWARKVLRPGAAELAPGRIRGAVRRQYEAIDIRKARGFGGR